MTIERAIHEHWSGWRPLTALVPPERIYTGLPPICDAAGETLTFPYVSIAAEQQDRQTRTSSGTTLAVERIRFSIYGQSYDAARRIDRAICEYFDRRDFAWSEGRVLDMQPAGRTESESPDDGVWLVARDFLVRFSDTFGSQLR